jgi:hypothetical protein
MKKRSSSKKSEITLNYLLKSRNVLYVVLFFSVANLFSYLMMKQLDAVAFFIIIGFLTTYFSKNMIIVMLTAMVSTFILVQFKLLGSVQEGMKDKEGMEKKEKKEGMDHDHEEGMEEEEDVEVDVAEISSSSEIPITEGQRNRLTTAKEPLESGVSKDRYATANKKSNDGFSQRLSPAKFNASDDDRTPNKPKFDYADTVESAYDNLDKLLSSDAIKNMSDDTARLAEKQGQLMKHIERIEPMVNKAAGLMEKFDFGKMNNALGEAMENVNQKADAFSKTLGKK